MMRCIVKLRVYLDEQLILKIFDGKINPNLKNNYHSNCDVITRLSFDELMRIEID